MKTDWSIMNMKVVYLLLVLAINSMDFQAFAQDCMPGTIRLHSRVPNDYSGILQYCYNNGDAGSQWTNVCGHTAQGQVDLACRTVMNSSATGIIHIYQRRDGVSSELVQLVCTQQTLSTCSPTLLPCDSLLYIGCKGICNDGRCACNAGYQGFMCADAICEPRCSNGGECVFPNDCRCSTGWLGDTCSIPICTHNCSGRGTCVGPETCTDCAEGWTGDSCAEAVCSPSCDNGRCTEPNVCSCNEGWNGTTCSQALCTQVCMNGGNCTAPNYCTCSEEWTGFNCTQAVCRPECENGGECTAPDNCTCAPGWTGPTCSEAICTDHCINGNCTQPNVCVCEPEWTGSVCSQAICSNNCENGGNCTFPNFCNCTEDWTGSFCTQPICKHGFCLNGGNCTYPNVNCSCKADQWSGNRCQHAICDEECENGGNCTFPNFCNCTEDWTGSFCTQPICKHGFCLNGGNCTYPNVNCSCKADQWSGNRCQHAICDEECENGGQCTAPNQCNCTASWKGETCTEAICEEDFCQHEGNCTYPNTNCSCTNEWMGNQCEIAICDPGFCLNGGTCLFPNTECTCPTQWNGSRCDIAICSDGFCHNEGNCSKPEIACTCTQDWEGPQCMQAVCRPNFCKNGGICLYPNTNCTSCPILWRGTTCNEVNYVFLAICVACVAVCITLVLLIICILAKKCKKSKKVTITKSFRRSLFGDDIKTISTPIVNPFLSGTALQMLNPQQNEESEFKVSDAKENNSLEKETDKSESKERAVSKQMSPEKDIGEASTTGKGEGTITIKKEESKDQSSLKDKTEVSAETREQIKTGIGITKDTLPKEDYNNKLLHSDTFIHDKVVAVPKKEESDALKVTEQPITSKLEQDITMLEDIIASLPQTEVQQGQMKPPFPQKEANGKSYDKLPSKKERKGNSSITSSQKARLPSGIYDTPVTHKDPKRSTVIYDTPVTQKKAQRKDGLTTNPSQSDEKNAIVCSNSDEGYTVPISRKRNTKKLESVSVKDRRDKNLGYENPDPHQRLSKQKNNASQNSTATLNNNKTPLSLHYAVSDDKTGHKSAILPQKSHENQYHMLERPSSPTQLQAQSKTKSRYDDSPNQYFTLEPPPKEAKNKRISLPQQPQVYHTLEPPIQKHTAIGNTRSMPVNDSSERNTVTVPSKDGYNPEYAIPTDHIRRDVSKNLTKTCQNHEYHVLDQTSIH